MIVPLGTTVGQLLTMHNLQGVTSNAQAHRIPDMVCLRCRLSHRTKSQTGKPCFGNAVSFLRRPVLVYCRW